MIKQRYKQKQLERRWLCLCFFVLFFLISCIYCICQLPVKRKRQQFFITVQSCHLQTARRHSLKLLFRRLSKKKKKKKRGQGVLLWGYWYNVKYQIAIGTARKSNGGRTWWANTEAFSRKTLKRHAIHGAFVCSVCVVWVKKSSCWQTLTVSVMVIVCQNLGGSAQQATVCVCLCICVCLCLCLCLFVRERACTCRQERVEQAPRCMSQQPSHQPF